MTVCRFASIIAACYIVGYIHNPHTPRYPIFYTLIMENTCEISLACIWILFEKCINKAWVWQLI